MMLIRSFMLKNCDIDNFFIDDFFMRYELTEDP